MKFTEVHIIQSSREEESAAAALSADSSWSAVTCSQLPSQTMKLWSISQVQHYAWVLRPSLHLLLQSCIVDTVEVRALNRQVRLFHKARFIMKQNSLRRCDVEIGP